MTKSDKIKRLQIYKEKLHELVRVGPTPKHKDRVDSYAKFLSNELGVVISSIEKLKAGSQ